MPQGRFEGTDTYVATEDLMLAVNAAITLERPLLIKGEPGTGKTMLAEEVSRAIGAPSHPVAHQVDHEGEPRLYEYDAVARPSRLAARRRPGPRHPQLHRPGQALGSLRLRDASGFLIDEIDKADIEFPNDLLQELDRMEFYVYETKETITALHRPIIVITSNNEKELPDAFLRRCFFHYIRFPDKETMTRIVGVHYPDLKQDLLRESLETFFELREVPGLKKKPSTSELLDWIKLLVSEDIRPRSCAARTSREAIPPLHGALLKNEQDVHLFERLAFLHRRNAG